MRHPRRADGDGRPVRGAVPPAVGGLPLSAKPDTTWQYPSRAATRRANRPARRPRRAGRSTRLQAATDQARTAEEALDAYLVDQNDEVVNYERVDGLGEVAGYAGSNLGVALGENHLVAILEVDGGFVAVVTKSSPEGTVEQLRPIAEELVKGVETKLR